MPRGFTIGPGSESSGDSVFGLYGDLMNVEVFIYFKEIAHGELGSILIRTGPTPCTGLVTYGKYQPAPILYAGSVLTLIARPDFLQYLACQRPI